MGYAAGGAGLVPIPTVPSLGMEQKPTTGSFLPQSPLLPGSSLPEANPTPIIFSKLSELFPATGPSHPQQLPALEVVVGTDTYTQLGP